MRTTTASSALHLTASLLLASGAALADPPESDVNGPVTGFMVQGRLNMPVGPSVSSSSSSSGLGAIFGIIPTTPVTPVQLGYRGESVSVGFGLSFASGDQTSAMRDGVKLFGLGVQTEFVVARGQQRRLEGYVFPGVNLLFASGSDLEIAWGVVFGGGARYWLTRHLGVHVDIYETITSFPASGDNRAILMQTVGSLGLTIVFGGR